MAALNLTIRDGNNSSQVLRGSNDGSGNIISNAQICDGTATHFMPTGDAVSRQLYFTLTDGTNSAPTFDTAARKGFIAITDGTNVAAVKPASTPAALGDPALVVAISPNSPLSKPTAGSPIRLSAKTSIKASAGALFSLSMINTSSSTVWVQLFDAATSGVTLGSTLPDLEFQVPANSQLIPPLPADGVPFGTAITYAATTTEAGATAAAAGALLLFPTFA